MLLSLSQALCEIPFADQPDFFPMDLDCGTTAFSINSSCGSPSRVGGFPARHGGTPIKAGWFIKQNPIFPWDDD